MAELEETKNGFNLECDCGLIHKIRIDKEKDEATFTTSGTIKKPDLEKIASLEKVIEQQKTELEILKKEDIDEDQQKNFWE